MSYASYDPGYQLEQPYGAYYEAPYAAAVPESVPLSNYGGRFEDPLEDTAGSSDLFFVRPAAGFPFEDQFSGSFTARFEEEVCDSNILKV